MESLAEQEFYLTSERIITILKTKGENEDEDSNCDRKVKESWNR